MDPDTGAFVALDAEAMLQDAEARARFYLLALVATWVVVVPYLVLFPPQLHFIRRRLQARKERQLIRQCVLKDKWEVKKRPADASQPPDAAALASNDHIAATVQAQSLRRWIIPRDAPVIVALVNRKSGGQLGATAMRCLHALLNPAQVFDLCDLPDIAAILRSLTGRFKLLICGGDGTVSWAMDVATQCGIRPPMAMLPLGTGNDLSRSLGWGPGFGMGDVTEDAVRAVLVAMHSQSTVQELDRWELTFTPKDGSPAKRKRMINYFSMGVDAEISLKFHRERLDFPERFSSQTKNVVKYALLGFEAAFDGRPLSGTVHGMADGNVLDIMDLWKGIIVSNVPYYHGGKNFWGDSDPRDDFGPCKMDDGQLEVMGLAGTFHIGLCNIHADSALRVGQGKEIVLELRDDCAVQIDGEPFPQSPCTVSFVKSDQYPMLRRKAL